MSEYLIKNVASSSTTLDDGPVVVTGDYTAAKGSSTSIEVDSPVDLNDPNGPFIPIDATLDLRALTQPVDIDGYYLGKITILGSVGGTINLSYPLSRGDSAVEIEDGGYTSWTISTYGNSGGDFTLGNGPRSIAASGFAASFTGSAGYQSLTLDLYSTEVNLTGPNNIISLKNTSYADINVSGSGNVIINTTPSSQQNTEPGATSVMSGAYATVSGFNYATLVVGAKSTLLGSFNNDDITAGAQTMFGDLTNCNVTASFKCNFGNVSASALTLERNGTIETLTDHSSVTSANGLSIGTLGNSSITGAGTVNIVNAVSGQYDAGSSSNLVTAQKIDLNFGHIDPTASAAISATNRGSVIYGGEGRQMATNVGPSGMTFISAATNQQDVFTAIGNADHDTFVAQSSMKMTGGAGASNLFNLVKGGLANDFIVDFTAAAGNKIQLSGFGLNPSGLSDILSRATTSSAGLILHINSQTTLTLAGVTSGGVHDGDFILG